MENILLTIILPIYNVEKYLVECIESVIRCDQYDNIEIILVDDGSCDGSPGICEHYAKEYNFIFAYHKGNGGLSDARNYGLFRAQGKYIFFLDSDDFMEENFANEIINVLQTTDSDVVLWDAQVVDENGKKISTKDCNYYIHGGLQENKKYTGKQIIQAQLDDHNDYVTTVWLGAYRRDLLIENCLWFEKGVLHEDELWTQKTLLAANSIYYINKKLYCYRERIGSIMKQKSHDYSKNIKSCVYIYNTLFEYYEWKVNDIKFLSELEANLVKRYLHMIYKYNAGKYPGLSKRINRKAIYKSAKGIDKVRAMILLINVRMFCTISEWMGK